MSTSRSTRSIIETYVHAFHSGDASRLEEIIAPDFHYRDAAPVGVASVVSGVRTLHEGFSQIVCTLEQCVCDHEWGSFRYVLSGVHTGVFLSRAATGKRITWSGADFVKVKDGKLVELWPVQENLPLLEGLGILVRTQ